MNRIDWFKNARFGMFIHFGLYSLYGKGEWVRSIEHIDEKDYLPYFDMFDPDIDFKYRENGEKCWYEIYSINN